MSTGTGIEWTDATWNPTSGCTHASPGCDHCYAKTMTYRLESMGQEKYRGLTVLNPRGDRHFNGVMRTDEDALTIPLSWRNPRRVFVNSMSDLFHKDVPFEFIDKVFAVMALTPQHTYQVLTKRPELMAEYLKDDRARREAVCEIICRVFAHYESRTHPGRAWHVRNGQAWPLPNVWLGTSVENQGWADKRIPHLLRCPAAVRFLSCEPLLGAIEFSDVSKRSDAVSHLGKRALSGIDWVIVGGESGAGARPMHPDWARSLRDQCTAAGVAFFFKQWGAWYPGHTHDYYPESKPLMCMKHDGELSWCSGDVSDGALSNYSENYDDKDQAIELLGKKASGRLLDGREWNEFPRVTA